MWSQLLHDLSQNTAVSPDGSLIPKSKGEPEEPTRRLRKPTRSPRKHKTALPHHQLSKSLGDALHIFNVDDIRTHSDIRRFQQTLGDSGVMLLAGFRTKTPAHTAALIEELVSEMRAEGVEYVKLNTRRALDGFLGSKKAEGWRIVYYE